MNYVSAKCLLFENGVAMLFEATPHELFNTLKNCKPKDVSITLTEYGFDLSVRSVVFPIQDNMIDHLAKHPTLILFSGEKNDYLMTPVYNIQIPPALIMEARGALNYRRSLAISAD